MLNAIIAALAIAVVLRPAIANTVQHFHLIYGIIAAVVFAMVSWLAIKIGMIETLVLNFNKQWYATVVGRLGKGSRLLDVGFGITGVTQLIPVYKSPTLNDIVKTAMAHELKLVCLEENPENFQKAAATIKKAEVTTFGKKINQTITMNNVSIYDKSLPTIFRGEAAFDAVCFSSPLMSFPDPVGALRMASSLLKEKGRQYGQGEDASVSAGGSVYIPVVLKYSPSTMSWILKPLFKLMQITPIAEVEKIAKEADMEVLGDVPSVGVDVKDKRPSAARFVVLRPVACKSSHPKQCEAPSNDTVPSQKSSES